MKLAAELAAEEINAAGGINGRPIELVARDDYADPDSAVFIANDLYEAGVTAVVGHLFSGPTLAAAPVYNGGPDPVVAISPSSSSPEISTAGDYTFRICPSDLAHGAALARWTYQRLGSRRGAVLYLNDQYGRGIRQTFVQEFTRLGRRARSRSIRTSANGPTSAPTSTAWSRDRAEFLIVAGNRGEAEEIIRQARRRGLTIPVLGGDGLEGIHEAGALAEGVYLSSAYFPTIADRRQPSVRRGLPSQVPRRAGLPNQPAAATYDALYLLRDVIARSGIEPRGRAPRAGRSRLGDRAVRRRDRHRRLRRRRATSPTRMSTSDRCSTAPIDVAEAASEADAEPSQPRDRPAWSC